MFYFHFFNFWPLLARIVLCDCSNCPRLEKASGAGPLKLEKLITLGRYYWLSRHINNKDEL